MARQLTPEEFGVPTVHFYLLSTVILTTREGFRRALMRDSVSDTSLRYAWFVLPIGGFLSIAVPVGVLWTQNISTAEPYGLALAYYGVAAFIELCAEPYYIRAMRFSAFKLRLIAESISTVVRSVLTYVLVSKNQNNVVMAFAYSQVNYLFHAFPINSLGSIHTILTRINLHSCCMQHQLQLFTLLRRRKRAHSHLKKMMRRLN